MTSGDLNMDLGENIPNTFMISEELWNAFFPFLTTTFSSRYSKGILNSPPSSGGKSRATSGRGLIARGWPDKDGIESKTSGVMSRLLTPGGRTKTLQRAITGRIEGCGMETLQIGIAY